MPIATTKRVWNGSKPALADIAWWEPQYDEKMIAHNTVRIGRIGSDEYPAVMFHGTVIIQMIDWGVFRINSGGYRTSTTKQRLNALLPNGVRVWQKDFAWFVSDGEGERPFVDGMEVRS